MLLACMVGTRCSKHMQARARFATTPHEERGPALHSRCRERRPRAPLGRRAAL